jgi:hypothetical protein
VRRKFFSVIFASFVVNTSVGIVEIGLIFSGY